MIAVKAYVEMDTDIHLLLNVAIDGPDVHFTNAVTVPSEQEPEVRIIEQTVRATQPVWTFWGRGKSSFSYRGSNNGSSEVHLVTHSLHPLS